MLVDKHLAACVNYFPITSVYTWKGKTETEGEYALLCKTTKGNFEKIRKKIKHTHTYELPCVISLPIDKGDEEYLQWIKKSVE